MPLHKSCDCWLLILAVDLSYCLSLTAPIGGQEALKLAYRHIVTVGFLAKVITLGQFHEPGPL
ncbi:hypothetical protein D3C74_406820 [compost metagenome]